MNIDTLENAALEEIAGVLQKTRKRSEQMESIKGVLTKNFEEIDTYYLEELEKLRGIVGGKAGNFIGNTSEMREVNRLIRQIAPSEALVLVRGSAGTGKEFVARSIHQLSERKDRPFVMLNCDSLNIVPGINSFESELFGYERGAFTGATSRHIGRAEQAGGGTLFLDEVANLSPAAQLKLLQFIQEKSFCRMGSNIVQKADLRLVASTAKNLEMMIGRGEFREDLYYRLNVFQITLPDLSQRKTDILLLADHFIEKMNLKYGKNILRLSSPAIDMLMSYHWPGNVRELENCIEHACLATTDVCINAYDLPPTLQTDVTSGTAMLPEGGSPLSTLLDSYEREILTEALRRHNRNLSAAGRELSVSPRMMHYKVKRLGILQ